MIIAGAIKFLTEVNKKKQDTDLDFVHSKVNQHKVNKFAQGI